MISAETRGVFAIAPTPFLPDGALDMASLGRMTERYVGCGVDGLTILGIMGEAQKLEPEESLSVVREVIAHAGGLPVVVGISAPGFAAMRRLSAAAMEMGAAGVMMTPPLPCAPTTRSRAGSRRRWRRSGPMCPSCCRIIPPPPVS